jgi:hypothetical protein
VIAYETGISPLAILECPMEIFAELAGLHKEAVDASKKAGR